MANLYNTEVEQVLLGALMSRNELVFRMDNLKAEHFFEPLHGRIFDKIVLVVRAGLEANPVILKDHMDEEDAAYQEMGGARYLLKLCTLSAGVANLELYAQRVREFAKKRKLQTIMSKQAEEMSAETDINKILSELEAEFFEPTNSFKIRTEKDVSIEIASTLERELPCYSTGIPALDDTMQGGLYEAKSYCIAARQKVGKTVALASISHNLSKHGVPHMFIAAEMGCNEIMQRLMAHDLKRNSIAFYDEESRSKQSFKEKVCDYAVNNKGSALFVDAPGITFEKLQQLVVSTVRRKNLKGVVLDYLQIVTGQDKGETEAQFQGRVAQWIAEICKQEGIFFLYAAQLNREGKLRGSDGILNAVDQLYLLKKSSLGKENTPDRYMELEATRYTAKLDVGSDTNPALEISLHGPYLIQKVIQGGLRAN